MAEAARAGSHEPNKAVYWLAAIVESTDDAIIGKTTDGTITSWNKGAERIYGYTAQDAIGRHISFLAPPERADDISFILQKIARGEQVAHFETVRIRKDGKPIDVSLTVSPIKDEMGRVIGASTIGRDITEKKETEGRLKESSRLNAALNRINVAINSTLDFEKIMQRVVVESAKALYADSAVIELRENERWPIRFLYGLSNEYIGKPLTGEKPIVSEIVARERRLIAIEDTTKDDRIDPLLAKENGLFSVLAVPLTIKGFVAGVLIFPFHNTFVDFSEEQIDFAQKLGATVSLALENARLYTAEYTIAHTLQEALLVVPQKIPGIDIGYLYQSASEEAQVGGDFYDLFSLQDGKIGILIGDVSGKGVRAATLTAFIEHTIKAYAFQGDTPSLVMEKTNEMLSRMSKKAAFITVFFGILNKESGRLVYCDAGHPAAIIRRGSEKVELLGTTAPIIGAIPGLIFEQRGATLSEGDSLVLYTDGVVEARRADGEFFGEKRLMDIIKEQQSTSEMPQHIFSAISNFAGGVFADDIAILSISLDGGAHA